MRLLGIMDLAKRWNYTKQGVHNKLKRDEDKIKPIGIINSKTMVFLEEEIEAYESKKRELTDEGYKRWYTYKYCYKKKD